MCIMRWQFERSVMNACVTGIVDTQQTVVLTITLLVFIVISLATCNQGLLSKIPKTKLKVFGLREVILATN